MNILITAGPTQEPLDPVRFISNYSTGYLGYRLAKLAHKRKHKVTIITGPTHIRPPDNIKVVHIQTAEQLKAAVKKLLNQADCLIMTAAVSDFRPKRYVFKKIKRKPQFQVELIANPDILKSISRLKGKKILVGFALEIDDLLKNAYSKLINKRLDLIVATRLKQKTPPFGQNKISCVIITKDGTKTNLKDISKDRLSCILLDKIERMC